MKNNDEVNKLSIQSTLCSVQFDVCRAITSQNHSQCFFHEYSSESCSTCMAWPNVFLFSSTFCEIQHEMFAYNILSSCRGHWSSKSVCHFIWMAFALNHMLLKMTWWTDEIPVMRPHYSTDCAWQVTLQSQQICDWSTSAPQGRVQLLCLFSQAIKAYLLLHLYLGGGFCYRPTMAECEGKERKVVLGVDASPHSERAFDCK